MHSLPSHARFSKKDLSEFKSVLKSDVISIEGLSIISLVTRRYQLIYIDSCSVNSIINKAHMYVCRYSSKFGLHSIVLLFT